jgi:hypothetical protein
MAKPLFLTTFQNPSDIEPRATDRLQTRPSPGRSISMRDALNVRRTTSPARFLLGHMLIEEVADLGECLFRFWSTVVA